ncbi:MAG: alpha/beta hydrolase [Polyangiaceae bacterium]
MTPESSPPPSLRPPHDETHSFVVADDGTRLFTRSKMGTHAAGDVRAFLCDGIACDGFIWKYLWEDLAADMPLTHWNYRGHGRSAAPKDPSRIDIVAHSDDLTRVRESVGDPPCILVGHSMGTQVVLENLRRNPANVRGLVLVCGSFGKITSTFKGMPILDLVLPKLIDTVLKAPEVARALWSRIPVDTAIKIALAAGEMDPARIHAADIVPYMEHIASLDLTMFLKMLRAAGEHTAWDLLPNVKVPVLVLAGERDTFTPPFLAEAMAKEIPDCEFTLLEKGSHIASFEQHEAADERIVRFVRERILAHG